MAGDSHHIVCQRRVGDLLVPDFMAVEQVPFPFSDEYHTLDKQGDRCDNSDNRNSFAWKRTFHGVLPGHANTMMIWKNLKSSSLTSGQLRGMTS